MIDILLNNKEVIFQFIIGLLFLIVGYYINYKVDTLRRNGVKTEGIVESYHEEIKSKEFSLRKTTTFYPIISFTDITGKNRQIISNVGSYPKPSKALPYDVIVYYLE